MRKNLGRVGVVAATTLGLICTNLTSASADEGLTVTFAGQTVTVGSTVATGQMIDGACHYAEGAVTIRGAASAGTVRMTALDDCRLVVTAIEAVENLSVASPVPTRYVAKVEMNATATGGVGGVGGVGVIGGGGVTLDDVPSFDDAPSVDEAVNVLAEKTKNWGEYRGITTQRFLSPAGFVQWEDQVGLTYRTVAGEGIHNWQTGTAPSYCGVNDTPDAAATPNQTDPAHCAMATSEDGVDGTSWVSTEGWGRYYQGLPLAGELFSTWASERFTAYAFGGYVGECDRSFVPPRWSVECSYSRTEVKAT